MAKSKPIIIPIRGREWKVYLLGAEDYSDLHEGDSAAITDLTNKEIHFQVDYLDLATVIHELCHAYFAGSYSNSANPTPDQVEELFCEMMGEFGSEIIRVSRKLRKALRELEEDL
jgi:hypothetical protein